MQPYIIAPSILSADLARLGEEVQSVLAAGADWIHFDVMDNHYVPNLTFGPQLCHALRQYGINAPIDVHLMVKPVDRLITMFAKAVATSISFHPEASEDVDQSLQLIRDLGCHAGIAINPSEKINLLTYDLDKLDMILLMTVNPGFPGQKLIPSVLEKIKETRHIIDKSGQKIRLEVDGGIHKDNIHDIAKAGADTFVAGSAIFGSSDYHATINALKNALI